jgi:hypothetical protein
LDRINNQKFEGPKFFENMYSLNLQKIQILQGKNDSLSEKINKIKSDTIPFIQVSRELKSLFTDVLEFEYGVYQVTDFKNVKKEVPTFHIKWKYRNRATRAQEKKLSAWLKERLQIAEVRLVSY